MKKGKIDYEFETVNNDRFKLYLEMRAGGQVVDMIFKRMKEALVKKLRLKDPRLHVDQLEKIQVDARYLNAIKIGVNTTLRNIYEEVRKDGVNVLHDKVVNAFFTKDKKALFWRILVEVEGVYNEKPAVKKGISRAF